jgi:hypothetical protein
MEFFAKALIAFVVLLVFALARKYIPATSAKTPQHKYSREELDVRFASAQWFVGFSMVVVGALFAFGTHAALVWLNRYLAKTDGSSQFLLWPQSAIWWFFPGFGALTFSWDITLRLWSLLGHREDADLYNYWSILKSGFDSPRLLRWFAVLIVLPVGILTILALPIHSALRQGGLRDCGFGLVPCKEYRYADARRMTVIDGFRDRDGKLTQRAGIVVDFSDGRRWSSGDIGDFNALVDPALQNFLENKIHLPFNHAQSAADIPPLTLEPPQGSK